MKHLEPVHENTDILDAQRSLQFLLSGYKAYDYSPHKPAVTEGEMLASFRFNVEAIDSEWEEIRDRLPWKRWKEEHRARVADGAPLSDDERLEIKYELVDALHFLMNMMISAGFESWHEVESHYFAKNRENLDRQERGY